MEKIIVAATVRGNSPTNAAFKITDTKLHVPVVTLSTENDNKLLEQLKTGFKRTIKWNQYRSEMSSHDKNNNLNYLIDPTFTKVNRLFVLSFEKNKEYRSIIKKKLTKKILKWAVVMIIQLVIY